MSRAAPSPPSDLPPRTWRGWWLAWPKWFRIGCWAGVGATILHVALAVRIYVGLMEPAEIQALRKEYYSIRYAWQPRAEWRRSYDASVNLQEIAMGGLCGRSWQNIVEIDRDTYVTDDVLKLIAERCTSLEILMIAGSDVSSEAISALSQCRELRILDLSKTNVDDDAVKRLCQLPMLSSLKLSETLVSDDCLPALHNAPRLEAVDLQYTDVSAVALYAWRDQDTPIIASERLHVDTVNFSIRWADGQRSPGFAGLPSYFQIDAPADTENSESRFTECNSFANYGHYSFRKSFCCDLSFFRLRGPGDFRFRFRLGEFEAEPVIANFDQTRPPDQSIEFVMPCTKAEALQSAKQPAQ